IHATRDTLSRNPDMVRRFIRATQRSFEAAEREPEAAIAAVMRVKADMDRALSLAQLRAGLPLMRSPRGQQRPIGWMARRYCRTRGIRFTTSFHTRFPEYLSQRFAIPTPWTVAALRRFHNAGAGLMVATPSLGRELEGLGFERVLPWTRGIDTELFHPRPVRLFGEGPVFLYVGRIASEKNIEGFLDLQLPGRKVVVGAGPLLDELRARYPDVLFVGKKTGEALAECYASADVFVFPSRTDTFGMVLLEAMASGVPVAALPVCGPQDVVTDGVTGVLSNDLRQAALSALTLDRRRVSAKAAEYSWEYAARLFLANITGACLNGPQRVQATRKMPLAKTVRPPQARV
ncbi:MAG: glycosyltransferase family 4 protein, partial [Hyphomicrobium sp.]